jgi:hypothetical protein
VEIRFQFSSTASPVDGFSDFTVTSDPTTASLGAGTQSEDWTNSQSMSYHCTSGGLAESVTFDGIDYGLSCSASGWTLGIDWFASALVCTRNFSFQPVDLFPDPTGVHVYNLSAFGGDWTFTITATISPY